MSSSETKATAWLVVPDIPFVEVSIFDGELRRVPLTRNTGEIREELPLGLYQIEFKVGDASETAHAALVRAGQTIEVAKPTKLRYSSAVPVEHTRTFHKGHVDAALALCRTPPTSFGTVEGSLLLFVRDADEATRSSGFVGRGLELLDFAGARIVGLEDIAVHDDAVGWAGMHIGLAAGTYRLRFHDHERPYEQALVVARRFCTQAFMLARGHWRDESKLRADPTSLSLQMVDMHTGLAPDIPETRMTEMALQAITSGRRLRGVDPKELLPQKFENPLLGLYGAHLLSSGERELADVPLAELRVILENLYGLLGPIPDVGAVRLAFIRKLGVDPLAGDARWPDVEPLAELPMLYAGWKRWVQASQENADLIERGSAADRIAGTAIANGPWLAWTTEAFEHQSGDSAEMSEHDVQDLERMLGADRAQSQALLEDPDVPAFAKRVAREMTPVDESSDPSTIGGVRELAQRLRVPIASARRAAAGVMRALKKRSAKAEREAGARETDRDDETA